MACRSWRWIDKHSPGVLQDLHPRGLEAHCECKLDDLQDIEGLHNEGLLLREKKKTFYLFKPDKVIAPGIKPSTNLQQSLLLKHSLTFPGVAILIATILYFTV